jgi:hypothetical protein
VHGHARKSSVMVMTLPAQGTEQTAEATYMGEYTSKDVPEPEGDSTIPSTRRGTRPTHPLSSATPTSKYSRRAAQN